MTTKNETRRIIGPEEVRSYYDQIVPTYQVAFAGEPWFEVSKCPDRLARCVGGLSSVAIGSTCLVCGESPSRPAYEQPELIDRFEQLAENRPIAWYIEEADGDVLLAALAWQADADAIAAEKYPDVPAMVEWLPTTLGKEPVVWLDEVFANRLKRPTGNLTNFAKICQGLSERLTNWQLAYRTISPQMVAAPRRDFGEQAQLFARNEDVPDRRDFVTINTGFEQPRRGGAET